MSDGALPAIQFDSLAELIARWRSLGLAAEPYWWAFVNGKGRWYPYGPSWAAHWCTCGFALLRNEASKPTTGTTESIAEAVVNSKTWSVRISSWYMQSNPQTHFVILQSWWNLIQNQLLSAENLGKGTHLIGIQKIYKLPYSLSVSKRD